METFKPNEVLEVLLCQHLYHERCINKWLGDHTSCCVCKADMEEMAKAIQPPLRRRRSRTPSETRLERSESLRSEAGYGSDQARSNFSSVSAPAAFAGRVPPDNRRSLDGDTVSTVSVLPTSIMRSDRTSLGLGHERAVIAAAGRDGVGGAPALGARSPSPMLRPPSPRNNKATSLVQNARSHIVNRSPSTSTATSTAAASVLTARPLGSGVQSPSLGLSVSTLWNAQSRRDSEEHSSSSSSSSDIISSINSDADDPCRLSPSPLHHRAHERTPSRRPQSTSSRFSRSSTRAKLQSPTRHRDRPPSLHPISASQVLPHVVLPAPSMPPSCAQWSRREFPSAVATLSTPQRMRRNSQPALSLYVQNSLSSASSSQVMMGPPWQGGSPSSPRRQLQLQSHAQQSTSAKSAPSYRRQWGSPEVGTSASSIFPCATSGGEPGREEVWEEGKLAVGEENVVDKLEYGAFRAIIGKKNPLGDSTPKVKSLGDEQEAKAVSISLCMSEGGRTRSRVWGQGKLTMEEEHGARRRDELEESAVRRGTDAGEEELRAKNLSILTEKPADDSNPMSDSLPPAGKLNGWANMQDDEDWLEDFDKTPTSEPGSHKTCSTQWSEMESHSSGMGSRLSGASGNSRIVDESSATSVRRRRSVPASPTTPRHNVLIAETKHALPLSVTVSPGVSEDREERWNGWVDRGAAGTPGSLTLGALTPGALRARSASAPMIWD